MKVSVFTPSFNKKDYVLQGIESVLGQTLQDLEFVIAENSTDEETRRRVAEFVSDCGDPRISCVFEDFSDQEREDFYPTAHLINKHFRRLQGDYILYMSDDDLLLPTCLQRCSDYLDAYPEASVVHFGLHLSNEVDGGWDDVGLIHFNEVFRRGTNLDCVLDGGQILMRRSCLEVFPQDMYPEEWGDVAGHCDGIFLTRLCEHFDFFPIAETLAIHRRTSISTFRQA